LTLGFIAREQTNKGGYSYDHPRDEEGAALLLRRAVRSGRGHALDCLAEIFESRDRDCSTHGADAPQKGHTRRCGSRPENGGVFRIAPRLDLWEMIDAAATAREQGPRADHYIVPAALNRSLAPCVPRELGLNKEVLWYDTTNFFTLLSAANDRARWAHRSHRRAKRRDPRHVDLALPARREFQLPLFHNASEDNLPDVSLFPALARELAAGQAVVAYTESFFEQQLAGVTHNLVPCRRKLLHFEKNLAQ